MSHSKGLKVENLTQGTILWYSFQWFHSFHSFIPSVNLNSIELVLIEICQAIYYYSVQIKETWYNEILNVPVLKRILKTGLEYIEYGPAIELFMNRFQSCIVPWKLITQFRKYSILKSHQFRPYCHIDEWNR